MKKITIVVTILIIVNFIFSNLFLTVYADTEPADPADNEKTAAESALEGVTSSGMTDYKQISDEGVASINGQSKEITLQESDVGAATSKVGSFLASMAASVAKVMTNVTYNGGLYNVDSEYSAEKTGLFTINSLIFGEYLIFNTKAYEKSTDLNPSITPTGVTATMDSLKEDGAKMAKVWRTISLFFILPMILVAIVKVMAANKAADLAAWKKILTRWVLCLILIYFFQYVFIVIDTLSDRFVDGFWNMRVQMEESGHTSFETTVEGDLADQIENTGGVTSLAYSVVFCGIVVMQVLFIVKYAFRTFAMLFLFIPLFEEVLSRKDQMDINPVSNEVK